MEVDTPPEEVVEEKPPEWWEIIPAWAWVVGAGVVGLVCWSIFARVTTPVNTGMRGKIALVQLFLGFCIFLGGHIWAFLYAIMKSADFGPIDVITKPFALWGPSNRILPKSAPRLAMAIWGLAAILLAVGVIGGINYNAMFEDWGFEEQAPPNLVQEILKKAKDNEGEGADSLEDAINDFAGEDETEEEVEEELVQFDCLVVGYTGESAENFNGLVLAALVKGRLRYVGTVFEGIPDEQRADLANHMKTLKRKRPFVKTKVDAQWLEPVIMCRITSVGLNKKNIMKKPVFKERLADAN